TLEVYSFKDSYEKFTELRAPVIDIRSDSKITHRRFVSKYHLSLKPLAHNHNKMRGFFKVESKLVYLLSGSENYVVSEGMSDIEGIY
ncbi:MAG: hypothetical protein WBM94_14770, partial [Eudoraea sp.]